MRKQIIPIVDEKDRIRYYKERDKRDPKKEIIRVAALWIENSKGEILITQRGLKIKNSPGKWQPAVAGTIEKGESYKSNMLKETEEEIGLKDFTFRKGRKYRMNSVHEYFLQFFEATLDMDAKDFKKDKREVNAIRWISKEKLKDDIRKHPERFTQGLLIRMR